MSNEKNIEYELLQGFKNEIRFFFCFDSLLVANSSLLIV